MWTTPLKYLRPAWKNVGWALAIGALAWLIGILTVSILLATMTSFNLSVWDWMLAVIKDPRAMLFVAPVTLAWMASRRARDKKKKR